MAERGQYLLILNPSHPYAEHLLNEMAKIPRLKAIGVFSLAWRYQDLKDFPRIQQKLATTICCFEGSDEAKADVIVEALQKEKIQPVAIIPWEDSVPILAGKLTDILRLPWNNEDITLKYKTKSKMKDFLRKNTQLRVNRFVQSDSADDLIKFQRSLQKWPVVIKPVDASGTWGVSITRSDQDIRNAVEEISRGFNVFEGRQAAAAMAEEYIGGEEYCVNGQTDKNGNILVTDVFQYDKRPANGHELIYFHSIYLHPDHHDLTNMVDYATNVIRATGLKNSPFHLELKVDQDGPCLIEAACRYVGVLAELVRQRVYPSLFEIGFRGYMNDLEFEKPFELHSPKKPVFSRSVTGVSTQEGVVTAIHGLDTVKKLASFRDIFSILKSGDRILPTIDMDAIPYQLFLSHNDRAQVERDAEEVRNLIRFEVS